MNPLSSWWRSVIEAEAEKKKQEGKPVDWWHSKPKSEPKVDLKADMSPRADTKVAESKVDRPLAAFNSTWGSSSRVMRYGSETHGVSGGARYDSSSADVAAIVEDR